MILKSASLIALMIVSSSCTSEAIPDSSVLTTVRATTPTPTTATAATPTTALDGWATLRYANTPAYKACMSIRHAVNTDAITPELVHYLDQRLKDEEDKVSAVSTALGSLAEALGTGYSGRTQFVSFYQECSAALGIVETYP